MRLPTISYLTDIYFDYGALALLPELLTQYSIARPLVVTDAGLMRTGIVERLRIGSPAVFDGVETNPTEASAWAGLKAFRESGCDGIVAVGGGSPIDLAKAVALLVNHEPPLEQYAAIRGGLPKIAKPLPALIAIPTTAGSGSEVGRAALLTLANGDKLGFLSPRLLPKAAICDPELTIGMPPALTAGAGMDALSHCVETFCSTKYNPVADAIALDGLERGWKNLRKAYQEGTNRESRREMMLCALMGGLTFQKSLGAVHSLSHPLGGLSAKRLHHGTLNALFLPHVLRFNYPACVEKMNEMARRMALKSGAELTRAFERLNSDLGLPRTLREMGVTKEELAPLAEKAFRDHSTPTNPRTLDVEACERLYAEAW